MKRRGLGLGLAVLLGILATAAPALAADRGQGGRIAFTSERSGGTRNIFTMRADGSHVRQLTFLTGTNRFAGYVRQAWSPDGRRFVVERINDDFSIHQLYLMDADGSHQHPLFAEDTATYADSFATFSPDGRAVIFTRCMTDGSACAIWTVGIDGHRLHAVTQFDIVNGVYDFRAVYSPDARSIAFDSAGRDGLDWGIYTMDARGGHIRRITGPDAQATEPDWAPDRHRIVFSAPCCNRPAQLPNLWSIRPNGHDLQPLTAASTLVQQRSPRVSPNGDRIAFWTADPSSFDDSSIVVMNADGSHQATIQTNAYYPSWGPSAEGR